MSRVRRSSWSSFLLGACIAAAVAVGSVPCSTSSARSSPLRTRDTAATQESAGYATPEDAVSAYIEALQQADLQVMARAFAIETFAANYDFTGYLELIRAYSPTAPIKLPASDPFNVALNIESRSAQVVGGILYQYLKLVLSGSLPRAGRGVARRRCSRTVRRRPVDARQLGSADLDRLVHVRTARRGQRRHLRAVHQQPERATSEPGRPSSGLTS